MEPSGCNRRQPVANANAAKTAQTSQNRCRRLRPVADPSDGKEGVDGTSPSEGLAQSRMVPGVGMGNGEGFGSRPRYGNEMETGQESAPASSSAKRSRAWPGVAVGNMLRRRRVKAARLDRVIFVVDIANRRGVAACRVLQVSPSELGRPCSSSTRVIVSAISRVRAVLAGCGDESFHVLLLGSPSLTLGGQGCGGGMPPDLPRRGLPRSRAG